MDPRGQVVQADPPASSKIEIRMLQGARRGEESGGTAICGVSIFIMSSQDGD